MSDLNVISGLAEAFYDQHRGDAIEYYRQLSQAKAEWILQMEEPLFRSTKSHDSVRSLGIYALHQESRQDLLRQELERKTHDASEHYATNQDAYYELGLTLAELKGVSITR